MSETNRYTKAGDVSTVLDTLSERCKTALGASQAGAIAASAIQSHLYEGKGFKPLSPATAGYRGAGRPLLDTGSLLASITHEQVNERCVSVGTNKIYAPLQNNGGIVRAKRGKWLWIPAKGTRQLQRRYGYSVREVLAGLRSAGTPAFFMGRCVCYTDKKKDRRIPVFYLKQSVEIPKREFFYLTDEEEKTIIQEVSHQLF